jgi:hypothetical protein
MTTRSCYVEIIDRLGTKAKWKGVLPDVAAACTFARQNRKEDEFIRIMPPIDLSAEEGELLCKLGVIPTEEFVPPPAE